MVTSLVKPHGGSLVERVVSGEFARAAAARAQKLPALELDGPALTALELIATGGAAPLRGFMTHAQYGRVLEAQRLPGGLLFPLPLVLPVRPGRLGAFPPGTEVALRDGRGLLRGIVHVADTFVRNLRDEALLVHGTTDPAHPRVAQLLRQPPGALAGEVTLLRGPESSIETTREVRLRLARQALYRVAAGFGAGLPELPPGDDPAVDALLVRSLADVAALDPRVPAVAARSLPRLPSRPSSRELVHHALVLKNHGASHLVVPEAGRDLAGADALLKARLELGVSLLRAAGPGGGAPRTRQAA
jgi:sulfate adenylyltransferase